MPLVDLPDGGPIGGAITGPVHHIVGSVIGAGVGAVFSAAGQWVASGAVWLLGEVGAAMSATTTVNLTTGWFSAHESVMVTLAGSLVLPMVLCAALQAVYRQSASMLARAFLVHLPLALLLTGVAVELVQMALSITDTLSSQVMAGSGTDTTNILAPVSTFLAGASLLAPGVPEFVVFIGSLLVAVSCLVLWLELVIRAAAVSVAVLFLPLALAALVWPAVSHWCRRLADTLVALILSKLVIAAVLSLAAGALAGGLGVGATASGGGGGFAAVITGIALLVIATFSPFTLLKLIPAIEAGASAHLESTRHRLASTAQAPVRARNLALDIAREAGSPAGVAAAVMNAVGTKAPTVSQLLGAELKDPADSKDSAAGAAFVGGGSDGDGDAAGAASSGSSSPTFPSPSSSDRSAGTPSSDSSDTSSRRSGSTSTGG